MARKVKDATLDSKAARRSLRPRGKPHYRQIEPGLHLGYRRLAKGAGKWVDRHRIGGAKDYAVETFATADDYSDADGIAVLDWGQALTKIRERMVSRAHAAAGKTGPYTVADAMDAYLEFLERERKSANDARCRAQAFIYPSLGEIRADELTADKLRKWLNELAKAKPRVRTKKDKAQAFREIGKDEDTVRRRRSSANRVLTILKAALNQAFNDGKIASDASWRKVKPFRGVDAARVRYLTIAEAKRLINACDPDFRLMVQAALQTGARYSELTRLVVGDFNPDSGTVAIRQSKSGKPRHLVLTDEGASFFISACLGRESAETIFTKEAGGSWGTSHQLRPIAEASAGAKITPAVNFHALRHTWASHAVMNHMPLMVVARNLGHADTRMVEKHYGHLDATFISNAIRAGAPQFGFEPDKKVTVLGEIG